MASFLMPEPAEGGDSGGVVANAGLPAHIIPKSSSILQQKNRRVLPFIIAFSSETD
jgi:hypothetical protein